MVQKLRFVMLICSNGTPPVARLNVQNGIKAALCYFQNVQNGTKLCAVIFKCSNGTKAALCYFQMFKWYASRRSPAKCSKMDGDCYLL